jgi:excinuclease UvrABC nuclease subunit
VPSAVTTAFDLQSFLATLPAKPGVYRMLASDDTIL